MSLREKLISDLKDAMKAKDPVRRDTLRLIDAALKNTEIEKKKRETGLPEEEILEVIGKLAKQRNDSIKQFTDGGRPDLAEKEKVELEIIEQYLPEQMGEDEVRKVVQEVITEVNPQTPSDLGKVMGQAMAKLKGKADGNLVRKIAQEELNK